MKRLNQKGFTLIELLAVITIMAILMLVAIPAVARTIENTRRDTFANVAGTYLSAVRNAVIADELKCGTGSDTNEYENISTFGIGTFYYVINSQSDTALMETGGKSPWGNAEVKGYVQWVKSGTNTQYQVAYSILLVDSGEHGLVYHDDSVNPATNGPASEADIKRQNVHLTSPVTFANATTLPGQTPVKCVLNQ